MELDKIALIASGLMVNARYSAYTFYQTQKGEPLTPEEMKEIADGVFGEVGEVTTQIVQALLNSSSDEDSF